MNEAAALLSWYRRSRRDLPWRRTRDPWAIWVSEVMLQQTRVEHVVAYFEPFLARFPSVAALAEAPLTDALAAWSGLGYYRRLRLLHRAAKQVMDSGEAIPSTEERLRRLPGVGDYTAAAVASIAFGASAPVLDGNVVRVMARRLACGEDPARPAVRRLLRQAAAQLLDSAAPGDSNQALMELGATLCTPAAPRCGECPLAPGCAARARGNPTAFPRRATRPRPRLVPLVVAVVERDDRVLLFRRDDGEVLLAGTWELPWIEAGDADGGDAASALSARYGGRFALGDELGRVRHAITTRRIVATVRRCTFAAREDEVHQGREAAWVPRAEVGELPTSSLVRKALGLSSPRSPRPSAPREAGGAPARPRGAVRPVRSIARRRG